MLLLWHDCYASQHPCVLQQASYMNELHMLSCRPGTLPCTLAHQGDKATKGEDHTSECTSAALLGTR